MQHTNIILSLILISILSSLSSSRVLFLIKILVFQGVLVSLIPLFLREDMALGDGLFSVIMIGIRGILIPWFMYVIIKKIAIKKEVEPIIGYHASIFIGLAIFVFAIYISQKFNLPSQQKIPLLVPTAITTLMSGMFLVMARHKAITMIIGYVIMENGIYLVGCTLSTHIRYIVEFGILLDVLVGVMLMGIVLNNINKTFDDIDTTLLQNLKE